MSAVEQTYCGSHKWLKKITARSTRGYDPDAPHGPRSFG
jgi:hypothetical protein